MATAPIHLAIPAVTTLEFLTSMLATCRTEADMMIWRQDYLDHRHLLTGDEQMELIVLASARTFHIAMGGVQ